MRLGKGSSEIVTLSRDDAANHSCLVSHVGPAALLHFVMTGEKEVDLMEMSMVSLPCEMTRVSRADSPICVFFACTYFMPAMHGQQLSL